VRPERAAIRIAPSTKPTIPIAEKIKLCQPVKRSRLGSSNLPHESKLPFTTTLADGWVGALGWTAPGGIDCARMRSLQISNKGDHPCNRLAELAWTRRNIFSSFMG
jgi:hypothetical protein